MSDEFQANISSHAEALRRCRQLETELADYKRIADLFFKMLEWMVQSVTHLTMAGHMTYKLSFSGKFLFTVFELLEQYQKLKEYANDSIV